MSFLACYRARYRHNGRAMDSKPANPLPRTQHNTLTLLGKGGAVDLPKAPSLGILETFLNRSAERDYWISFDCADFSSLCPVTGQPDFAKLRISYIADQLCIETKSLKFYLAAYRNEKAFNEEVINQILNHLVEACQPRRMMVRGVFSARGGISVTVDAFYPDALATELWPCIVQK